MTQSIEITDGETGEVFELKTEMLVSNVRDLFMTRRRNDIMKGSWANLSEDDQQDEIVAVTEMARGLIEKIVEVVATAGRDVVHAKLDKFVIKDGTVQLTATGIADDGVVLALNHVGNKAVKIIVADADDYDKERDEMDAMPDQTAMFADGGEVDATDVDGVDYYTTAVDLVKNNGKCSTSYIQRALSIGYNKAAKIVEEMEAAGIVSAPDHVGKREVLIRYIQESPEEIGAAMDTDLEQLEDGDDLHVEDGEKSEQTDEAPEPTAKEMGSTARLAGAGPDENPFDGGSDDAIAWSEGYDFTDDEINSLKGAGHAAADAGEDRHGGKWKEGTDARRFWMEGYDEFEQPTTDATSDGQDDGDGDPIKNDSFAAGVTAAERGESLQDNPNEEGSVQFRYWDQGYNSIDPVE